jgi:phage terminase small subunit
MHRQKRAVSINQQDPISLMTDKETTLPTLPDDMPKREKLLRLLPFYNSIPEAARAAGYSEYSATSNVYTLVKSPKFQNKLREYYNAQTLCMLPKLVKIENDVIDKCLKDVDSVPKFKDTLKQIKQSSGVLAPEQGPGSTVINVSGVRQFMLQLTHERKKALENPTDTIDVEPETVVQCSDNDTDPVSP